MVFPRIVSLLSPFSPLSPEGLVSATVLAERSDNLFNPAIGGDYQRYCMAEGKRDPHIIDPRTGETVDLAASVTIITSGGADAGLRSDGNAKPLFITRPAGWEAMAARMGMGEVLLIDADERFLMTPAMRARLNRRPQGG